MYNFTLTKVGRLRKSTTNIIKENYQVYKVHVLEQRWTKSYTHNLESHHLVLDEDNALIGTSEDDEKASPLYISYNSDSRS